jgi:UPF0755 protein
MFDMPRKRVILLCTGLIFMLGVFLALGMGLFVASPAKKGGAAEVFIVREGEAPRVVAEELDKRGIITSKELFLLWVKCLGYGKEIKAGEYSLGPGMAPMAILEKLRRGLVITHPVTVPEGLSRVQIAELLAEKGLISREKFLSLTRDRVILERYGISGPSLEGYLYPDTYQFARGILPHTIIETMVKRFFQMAGPLKEAAEKSGMKMEEVITLASIVEKETGRPEERPIIASVFLNRLKRGMRLDSDPTVIYGLEAFNGDLRKKDLIQKTPYNTYVISGLPPGPIANPGLASIKAVVYPAKTDYLYFVSKNDGSHHFAKTLPEHNRAVNIYQKKKGQIPKKATG